MSRLLIPDFLHFKKQKLSDKIGSFLVILFCLFNQMIYAQDGIGTDTLKATIFVESGAAIFSTDETFNQQIINKEVAVKSTSISYKKYKKVLKLGFTQSITIAATPKNNEGCLQKNSDRSLKKIIKKVKSDVVRDDEFKKYRFENNPSTNSSFNACIGRDYYVLNISAFKASKIAIVKIDFSIKRNLNDLYSQLPYFYNSKVLNNSFLLVYSVRPPPGI